MERDVSAFCGPGWQLTYRTFGAAEVSQITGIPQALLRLWRSRDYLPKSDVGKWSRHDAEELGLIGLLYGMSTLGVAPKDSFGMAVDLVSELLFFAATSCDGACEFRGSRNEVEKLRANFDDSLEIATAIFCPGIPQRFALLQRGGQPLVRCVDLAGRIEAEELCWFSALDLVAIGRQLAARSNAPLFCFHHNCSAEHVLDFRQLSRGRDLERSDG